MLVTPQATILSPYLSLTTLRECLIAAFPSLFVKNFLKYKRLKFAPGYQKWYKKGCVINFCLMFAETPLRVFNYFFDFIAAYKPLLSILPLPSQVSNIIWFFTERNN